MSASVFFAIGRRVPENGSMPKLKAFVFPLSLLPSCCMGAAKSDEPAKSRLQVERLTARLEVLTFDQEAAAHYGDIRADLERRGCVIGPYDLMIAGHARSQGLVVVTGNLGEFTRVDGLRCEDWLSH
jgi:predicted nucleic acid-binding protein